MEGIDKREKSKMDYDLSKPLYACSHNELILRIDFFMHLINGEKDVHRIKVYYYKRYKYMLTIEDIRKLVQLINELDNKRIDRKRNSLQRRN